MGETKTVWIKFQLDGCLKELSFLWCGGAGGGRVIAMEGFDFSEELLYVGVLLGGGGGESSVVVNKMLEYEFFVGDRCVHVVDMAIQLPHDCGLCGVIFADGDGGVDAAKIVAVFYGGTSFVFQSSMGIKEGCFPVSPCFEGSIKFLPF